MSTVVNSPGHPQALILSFAFLKRVLHKLVESGRYDTRTDFTVVIQPFFREVVLPRTSVSEIAVHHIASSIQTKLTGATLYSCRDRKRGVLIKLPEDDKHLGLSFVPVSKQQV